MASPLERTAPSRNLQGLPSDQSVRLPIPLARRLHYLRGQRRRRCVAVPLPLPLQTRQVIAQRLLVEARLRSEEHTSELQSRQYLVCRLLLEKKKSHSSLKLMLWPHSQLTTLTATQTGSTRL